MNKKSYTSPSMNTIILRQQLTLLAGSGGVEARRGDYGEAETESWD